MPSTPWPALPLEGWRETYDTLHMWMQIPGKICLALTPRTNHFWNIAFHVTSRGLTTTPMPFGGRIFTMAFDFVDHQLIIEVSDGTVRRVALEPKSVAAFYREVMAALHEAGIDVSIWKMPVEFPDPIRFDRDETHRAYDAAAAQTCWQILTLVKPVMERFRSRFIGKCSPVHFFWGSFDLAVTRFSGRRAPERPGADAMTRESYSHEVISHGWWPGGMGDVQQPAFYAYAAPAPEGLKDAPVSPAGAYYSGDLNEFILPYDTVRISTTPETDLLVFMESTYDAAADLAGWDRASLERSR